MRPHRPSASSSALLSGASRDVISGRINIIVLLAVLAVLTVTSLWIQGYRAVGEKLSLGSIGSLPFARSLSQVLVSGSGVRQTERADKSMPTLLDWRKRSENPFKEQNVTSVSTILEKYSRGQGKDFARAGKRSRGSETLDSVLSKSEIQSFPPKDRRGIKNSSGNNTSRSANSQAGSQFEKRSLLVPALARTDQIDQAPLCVPWTWALDQQNVSIGRVSPPLDFVHIDKNGGIAIESAGLRSGIKWGSYRKNTRRNQAHVKGHDESCRISWWHMSAGSFDSDEEFCGRYGPQCRSEKFCVVRDPRTRIFNQLGDMLYYRQHSHKAASQDSDVEEWLMDRQNAGTHMRVFRAYTRKLDKDPCFGRGKFFGQYDMVFDRTGRRWCDHVLRFEDLKGGVFERLMQEHGMCGVKLADTDVDQERKLTLRWNNVPEDLRQWILRFYHKDFEAFYPEVLKNSEIGETKSASEINMSFSIAAHAAEDAPAYVRLVQPRVAVTDAMTQPHPSASQATSGTIALLPTAQASTGMPDDILSQATMPSGMPVRLHFTADEELDALPACPIAPHNWKGKAVVGKLIPDRKRCLPGETPETLLTAFTTLMMRDKGNLSDPHNRQKVAIQRNTLRALAALAPEVRSVVFTDSSTFRDMAQELGMVVVSSVRSTDFGLPYLKAMYDWVDSRTAAPLYGYMNADILFGPRLVELLQVLLEHVENGSVLPRLLLVGRRFNIKVPLPVRGSHADLIPADVSREQLEDSLTSFRARGSMAGANAIDYFFITRGAWNWDEIPDFVPGRRAYDRWFVDHAYRDQLECVDVTKCVFALHQTGSDGNSAGNRARQEPMFNFKAMEPYIGGRKMGLTDKCNIVLQCPTGQRIGFSRILGYQRSGQRGPPWTGYKYHGHEDPLDGSTFHCDNPGPRGQLLGPENKCRYLTDLAARPRSRMKGRKALKANCSVV